LVVAKSCQEIRVPAKSDVPSRDTRTSQIYAYNVRWMSKLGLLSLIAAVNKNIYQQQKIMTTAK
jgi:hypothetical protein